MGKKVKITEVVEGNCVVVKSYKNLFFFLKLLWDGWERDEPGKVGYTVPLSFHF